MKNCLGIEIGHYRIKIAYAEKGELKEFISERVQGMDLTDMHVCADLIMDLLKEYAIRCRNVVFVIRQEDVYVRRFEMPLMTEEQLRLNLPYEFHDYIGGEMDKYVFDYAMIQTKEGTMDLLGAACTKTLSQQFEKLAKMARLKLVGLVPAVLGLERILEYAQERKDYAVLDLGTQALRIHFFREAVYAATEKELRTLEKSNEVYGEVLAEYAHYGNGYLNEEESKLPDRRMMLDSLKSQIFPLTAVSSVSITSDQMSLEGTIPNGTLFPQLVRDAEADPNARYVTASLEETVKKDGEERVLASLKQVGVSMAVFFNEPEEGKEE